MTHRAEIDRQLPTAISDLDLAYLAGLLDGEGHFGTGPLFKAEGRNRGLPALRITMTDRQAVEWCRRTFGGRLYRNGRSARGRVVFGWTLTRQEDLRALLPMLMPHLKLKGAQAWALLRVVEELRAQPVSGRNPGPRVERQIRRDHRLRWRFGVARAQQAVREARIALSAQNPTNLQEALA